MWDLRDPSIRYARLVELEHDPMYVQGCSQKFWFGGAELHIYIYIHLHSYIYIYILEIIIFINFNEYKQIVYFAINMYKNVLPLFNCNFFKSLIFGVISSP